MAEGCSVGSSVGADDGKSCSPRAKPRQEQLEADLRKVWKNDPLAQKTEEPRYTSGTQESENPTSPYFIGDLMEARVGIEPSSLLERRKLFIPSPDTNEKNGRNTEARYTEGTRDLNP
jgi:hypothetical protein